MLLARRAAGSMRDSQSLLEQLFSFCGDSISVDEVHQLLGTTDMGRIGQLGQAMAAHDSGTAMRVIGEAVADGVDAGQFASQLLGYFRDMMALRVGCGLETMTSCDDEDLQLLGELAEQFGLETILNIVQILDQTVVRMQSSVHAQTLLEVASIRICNLESLDSLADLVDAISDGKTIALGSDTPSSVSKKNSVVEQQPSNSDVAAQPAGEDSMNSPASKADVVATTVNNEQTPVATYRDQPESNPAEKVSSRPVSAATDLKASEASPQSPMPAATPELAPRPPQHRLTKVSHQLPRKHQLPRPLIPRTGPESSGAPHFDQAGSIAPSELSDYWLKAAAEIQDMTADIIRCYQKLELTENNSLLVTMPDTYNRDLCNRPERRQKIESAFEKVSGRRLRIDFAAAASKGIPEPQKPKLTRRQQLQKLQEVPIVKKTLEIFNADNR